MALHALSHESIFSVAHFLHKTNFPTILEGRTGFEGCEMLQLKSPKYFLFSKTKTSVMISGKPTGNLHVFTQMGIVK